MNLDLGRAGGGGGLLFASFLIFWAFGALLKIDDTRTIVLRVEDKRIEDWFGQRTRSYPDLFHGLRSRVVGMSRLHTQPNSGSGRLNVSFRLQRQRR